MGILDILKNIFKEDEEEKIREKINFSNLENVLENKLKETKEKEKEIISLIKERIDFFTKELKENSITVENVDIEQKEKNEKVKSMVYEGRKKYLEFLERFIENIQNSQKTNLDELSKDINSAFLRLNENSIKSYERATILIGKEMGNIRDNLKKFSTELLGILNNNKEINTTLEKINLVKSKIEENKEINEKLAKGEKDVSNINKNIEEKEKEIKKLSKDIEDIKKSSEYIENLERQNNLQLKEKEFEESINELRQSIDFKALSSFFHIFPEKMNIVKNHRENFTIEFKREGKRAILGLLDESKLNNQVIEGKIKEIEDKEQEILNLKDKIKKIDTEDIESGIERAQENLNNLLNEREWADKNKEKMNSQIKENKEIIKKQLELLNIDLED
ncbi:MAG: hypothetical protein ACP5NZ_02505 [Nanobdellota archaeon]